jgi:hypothetical protein
MKKLKLLLLLALTLLCLSGCAKRELDSIAIISCLEVTKANNVYSIQAEIVRLTDSETEPGQDTEIITANGKTFEECINNLNETEVLHIYLGHLKLIIFDKAFLDSAEINDFEEIAAFSVKNPEIRFNTVLAVSDQDFGKAINARSASTGNRGMDLSRRIRELNTHSELCDFINCLDGYIAQLSLPVITVSDMNGIDTSIVKNTKRYNFKIK